MAGVSQITADLSQCRKSAAMGQELTWIFERNGAIIRMANLWRGTEEATT